MPASAHNGYPALPPHLDPRGRHHQAGGRQWRAGAARIGLSLGALLSVSLLILAGYVWYTFRNVDRGITRVNVADAVGHTPSNAVQVFNGKDQNILIVGNDDRSQMTAAERRTLHVGRDDGSKATDTMMVVHIPADGSKATLISLPRDSYVHIAGHGMDKLNSAYGYGYLSVSNGSVDERRSAGARLLISTISELTGLTIDHYIQVSLLGFYEISQAIGGVPITLCHNVDDTYAANHAAGLTGGSGLKLAKGKHVISGVQALEFVRQRHFLPRGDLDRVRRQQYFLTSAFRQVASVGILFKLNSVGTAVKRNIYFDPNLHLIDLARQMENLSANNITGKTIPTSAQVINGSDVLVVDPAQVHAMVENVINGPATPSATPTTSVPAGSRTATPGSTASKSTGAIDAKCIN